MIYDKNVHLWSVFWTIVPLKGQCHKIFCISFFFSLNRSFWSHENYPRAVSIFSHFGWVISILRWLHGACDTTKSKLCGSKNSSVLETPSEWHIFHVLKLFYFNHKWVSTLISLSNMSVVSIIQKQKRNGLLNVMLIFFERIVSWDQIGLNMVPIHILT